MYLPEPISETKIPIIIIINNNKFILQIKDTEIYKPLLDVDGK
jgi:hypothetical protein